jgi:DmsE family decaheme c-type cytochrome
MSWAAQALAILLVAAARGFAADAASSEKTAAAQPSFAGEEMCAACHEEAATSHAASPHRVLSDESRPEAQRGCEACHGPGGAHAEESGAVMAGLRAFASSEPAAARSEPCLGCHAGEPSLHGTRQGEHALSGVACNDCHRVHGTTEHLLRKPEPELCYGCHLDIRAKFLLPEHHEVPEGVLGCLDCHEAHRARRPLMMRGSQDRASCVRCHAEVEGPFVFEHAGLLVEGCERCHDPHGSVNRHLLVRQQVAQLCYECHTVTPPDHVQPNYRDCTRCHTAIHGSNFDPRFLER